jgi:hypothetical protein
LFEPLRSSIWHAFDSRFVRRCRPCQTTLSLDDDELEQVITQQFQTQTGVTLGSIDCPSDRPLQQGDTFTCSATTELDEQLTLSVVQTDDQGHVTWSVASE